jgi:berberine-like enzyme
VHPVGPVVFGGPVAYDPSIAGDVLRAFRDLSATAPNELAVDGVLMGVGPEDTPAALIAGCYAGPVETGQQLLAPARGLGEPLADGMAPMPYVVLQALLDDKFPHGQFHYWTARTFDGLSDAVLDLVIERWRNARLAMVPTILIEGLGGAISAVPAEATAYGDREAKYQIAILAVAPDRESFDECAEWGRSLLSEIDPHSRGGGYVNYLDDSGENEVRVAYRGRYERLAQLKALYDPDNVFRLNQNIKPMP